MNNQEPITKPKDIKPKQIYHKVKLNQENILRKQLLGNRDNKEADIENADMNKLLKQQQQNQEKLAMEMLKSVESIKNNSLVAKRIITSDNKVYLKCIIEG